MSKYSIISIVIAVLVSWTAMFFVGRSTVKRPVIEVTKDTTIIKIDTVFLTSDPIHEIHDIIPVTAEEGDTVELGGTTLIANSFTNIFVDTLNLNNDNAKGEIVHTTIYDGENAIGLWDIILEPIPVITKYVDKIIENTVYEEVPVDSPFYSDHWFWSWLITAGGLILALIGAI